MPPVSPDTRSLNQHLENKKNFETSQFNHLQYNTTDNIHKVDIDKVMSNKKESSDIIITTNHENEKKSSTENLMTEDTSSINKNKALKKEKINYNNNEKEKEKLLNEKMKSLEEESSKIKKIYDKDNIELMMDEDLKNEEVEVIKSLPKIINKTNFSKITESLFSMNKMYQTVIENKFFEIYNLENPDKSNQNNSMTKDDFVK